MHKSYSTSRELISLCGYFIKVAICSKDDILPDHHDVVVSVRPGLLMPETNGMSQFVDYYPRASTE